MKKLLLLMLITTFSNAQTLLQENFNTLGSPISLPSGWETTNLSSPIGSTSWFNGNTANFAPYEGAGYISVNFQSGSGVSYLSNWLISPPITVQNGDQVSFYTIAANQTYPDRLELRRSDLGSGSTAPIGSTGVGSYSTLCLSVNESLTGTGYPQTWTKYTYTVSGLTGQVSCRFALRYHVPNGGPSGANSNLIGVDSFQVKRPVMNDLSLNSVVAPEILNAGNYTFNGTVQNQGSNPVTSYQVTWQEGSGALNTYSVTGLNIASGATHSFSHDVPFNAVAGQSYALNFSVSTVNGTTDGNALDNNLSRNITVVSGSTTMLPLIEKFTANWCGPCASYNANTFNNFYATNNSNFTYIAYHASSTDGNTNADSQARGTYYGFGGYPTVYFNSTDIAPGLVPSTAQTNTGFANAQSKPAYVTLNSVHSLNGNQISGNVNFSSFITGSYKLRIAVVENTTSLNLGSNGETSFKHVLRKMIPNAAGSDVTFTASQSGSFPFSADLTGLAASQLSNLSVVVFVQNESNKEIFQSAYSTLVPLSVSEQNILSDVTIYPNPAEDFIKISNVEDVNVMITDVTGKTVLNIKNVSEATDINVSGLNSGVYFVNVSNEEVNQTIKFIKK